MDMHKVNRLTYVLRKLELCVWTDRTSIDRGFHQKGVWNGLEVRYGTYT